MSQLSDLQAAVAAVQSAVTQVGTDIAEIATRIDEATAPAEVDLSAETSQLLALAGQLTDAGATLDTLATTPETEEPPVDEPPVDEPVDEEPAPPV